MYSSDRIYPNVETLGIFDIYSIMPDEWVKTYPNVSQLESIFDTSFSKKGEMGDDEARYRSHRERNMHALADLDQCWPRLEEASLSCVAELYSLGLPCHIRALEFFEVKWCLQFFPETMEYARPVVLELSTHARYIGTPSNRPQMACGISSSYTSLFGFRMRVSTQTSRARWYVSFFHSAQMDHTQPMFSCAASTGSNYFPNSGGSHFDSTAYYCMRGDGGAETRITAHLPMLNAHSSCSIPGSSAKSCFPWLLL